MSCPGTRVEPQQPEDVALAVAELDQHRVLEAARAAPGPLVAGADHPGGSSRVRIRGRPRSAEVGGRAGRGPGADDHARQARAASPG